MVRQEWQRDSDLALAHHLAELADGIASARWRADVTCRTKADGTAVTDVDLAVERAMLEVLAAQRPGDTVVSEEAGTRPGDPARRWILDPVDGTSRMLAGRRDWGTHIALDRDGQLDLAVLTRPTEQRRWWAVRGAGAFTCRAGGRPRRLRTSSTSRLAGARVGGLIDSEASVARLIGAGARWVDDEVSPVAAMLDGAVDVLIDDAGHAWDQAPAVLLVTEAGGRFCDRAGGTRYDLGWGVYSNAHLHGQVRRLLGLRPAAEPPDR